MAQVAGNNQYTHLNANATTNLRTGNGVLHSITINTKGATSNTLTLYDNTVGSGTVIALIDTTSNVQTLIYDLQFLTGLTAVIAAGTAADVTITWQS